MEWETLNARLSIAIEILGERDSMLLRPGKLIGERALAHRLALHLQSLFPSWDVDCEYNRMTKEEDDVWLSKRLGLELDFSKPCECGNSKHHDSLVYPDISIHKRGLSDKASNLLVIELKKTDSGEDGTHDHKKLKAYTDSRGPFQYEFGLFLVLGDSGVVAESVPYQNGVPKL